MSLNRVFMPFMALGISLLLFSCQEDDWDQSHALSDSTITGSVKRTCLSTEHHQYLMQNNEYKKKCEQALARFAKMKNNDSFKSHCNNPVNLPVAIHYQNVGSTDRSCLTQMAIDQVNRANLDFSGHNSDISNWTNGASAHFPGISNGEMCVQFVIADQGHPGGYGLSDGQLAITINQTQGDQLNDWAGYVNIIVQSNTGSLGYAPLGGFGDGDGVVIDIEGFGAGSGCGAASPQAPFNLGRTLTHELGHYLFLDHIWGNGCGTDDEVGDTPDQEFDYSGCPALGSSSCGSVDMHMNYMDYSDDACMYMFSAGQVARMTNYLQANLSHVSANASNVYSGSPSTPGGGSPTGGDPTGGDPSGGDPSGGDPTGGNNTLCQAPSSSTVVIQSQSVVLIDWEDVNNADRYRIRYRVEGSTSWNVKGGSQSQKRLTGLSSTLYEYQLRSRCPDGWTSWSSIQTFDLSPSSPPQSGSITIEVTLDDYGSETQWELYDQNNTQIQRAGPFADGQAGTLKDTSVSLPDGCYEIDLYDSFGDGICCDYGNGKFEIYGSNRELLAHSDGRFGYYELVQFCVENGSARIVNRERDARKNFRGKTK